MRGLVDRQLAVDRTLGDQPQLGGDALPFGHLGRGPNALELIAECAGVGVVCERALEGVVAKRLDGRYLPGERAWVKTKNRETWWRYELERERLPTTRVMGPSSLPTPIVRAARG